MTRVRRELDLDLLPFDLLIGLVTKVILHIAIAKDQIGHVVVRKFIKENGERFLKKVRKDIETAAVGHAHDHFNDAMLGELLHQTVQRDHERVPPLERETLLPDILAMEEALEEFRLGEPLQRHTLGLDLRIGLVDAGLDPLPDPVSHFGRLDVHELKTDLAAIGALKTIDEFAQFHAPPVFVKLGRNLLFELRRKKPHLVQAEKRLLRTGLVERVEPGGSVTEATIVAYKRDDTSARREIETTAEFRSSASGCGRQISGSRLCQTEFKAFKKHGPALIDRVRVLLPNRVFLVDQIDIRTGGNGMAHQADGSGLAQGNQSRFIRDNWLEKIQDFPRKNAASVKVHPRLPRAGSRSILEMT